MQQLPGIKKVSYVQCESLPEDIVLSCAADIPVAVFTSAQEIALCEEGSCECESFEKDTTPVENARLRFRTTDLIPFTGALAFIIEDVEGKTYLIGQNEYPHPKIRRTWSSGAPSQGPAGWSVEVTFEAERALIPCTT